jgi:hypothetical protein
MKIRAQAERDSGTGVKLFGFIAESMSHAPLADCGLHVGSGREAPSAAAPEPAKPKHPPNLKVGAF